MQIHKEYLENNCNHLE